ncbi:MAG: DUF192 domain-containing protein [Campylobacteraceae bacterium]
MKKGLFLLFLIFTCKLFASNVENLCILEMDNGYKEANLPSATTQQRREIGLSNKADVGVGMVFVFENPRILSFWMKNTFVPLSIGFFDENGVLFQIENMEPLSLKTHSSKKNANIALELKEGDFEKLGIKIGDKITKLECR